MKCDPHHEQVMEIFLGACDLEGPARASYLEEATGTDEALRKEIEQLLNLDGGGTITLIPDQSADGDENHPEPRHHAAADRYAIGELIAEGGTAAIYKAYDRNLNREIALKRLLDSRKNDPEARTRMIREAIVTSSLEHPGIPSVHEIGKFDDGEPYIAYRLVRGKTLTVLLKERDQGGDRELSRFLEIFERICQAVAYAHGQGIIHRDLKPHNVMVDEFGDVQVMDWGLTAVVGAPPLRTVSGGAGEEPAGPEAQGGTRMGAVLGTPAYMAPEQSIGRGDRRSDVFGLGAILCEILTGAPPFVAKSEAEVYVQAVKGNLDEAVERLRQSAADRRLIDLAVRCLSSEPEERPVDAGALLGEVAEYRLSVAERLREAELAAAEAQTKAREERKRLKWIAALSVAVLGLVGVLWFDQHREGHRRAAQREQGLVAIASAEELATRWMVDPVGDLETEEAAITAHETAAKMRARDDRLLAERLRALEDVIKREQRDRRFARTLAKYELGLNSRFSWYSREKELIAVYADAFKTAGFELSDEGVENAGMRIRSLSGPVRATVMQALAKWVVVGAPKKRAESWPMRVLIAVDPDPWRLKWREALASAEAEPLVKLGRDPAILDRAPFDIAVLAYSMRWTPRYGKGPFTEEIVSLLRRAGLRYPENFEIKVLLSTLLGESVRGAPPVDTNAAARYALAAASLRPGAATWCRYGRLLRLTGDKEGARGALESALRYDPDHPGSLYELGNVYLDTNRPAEAATYLERLVAFGEAIPTGAQASFHSALGSAARRAGDEARAEEALLKAVELALTDRFSQAYLHTYYGELGQIYRGQGRWEEAVAMSRRAVELKPKQASAHLNLARALQGAGRHEEALQAARTAVELAPGSPEAKSVLEDLRSRQHDQTAE